MQIKDSSLARVFFALWPEASLQQALHALAQEYQLKCKARAMRADSLHMTLLFLGEISRARLPELMHAAGKVSVPPFEFALQRLSFWQHNRIGYAASLDKVPALDQLLQALQHELISAGFQCEHRVFIPHVTLLRNVRHVLESQTFTPIMWDVDKFVLVESVMTDQGVQYPILQSWPLAAAAVRC